MAFELAFQLGKLAGQVSFVASSRRKVTNARMMATLTCTARPLRKTLDSIATPCSVKTKGR